MEQPEGPALASFQTPLKPLRIKKSALLPLVLPSNFSVHLKLFLLLCVCSGFWLQVWIDRHLLIPNQCSSVSFIQVTCVLVTTVINTQLPIHGYHQHGQAVFFLVSSYCPFFWRENTINNHMSLEHSSISGKWQCSPPASLQGGCLRTKLRMLQNTLFFP